MLFVIPVIPDEIICIGASLGSIKFKFIFPIALFAKTISIGMVTYSEFISKFLKISQFNLIVVEIILMLFAAFIYKIMKKEHRK